MSGDGGGGDMGGGGGMDAGGGSGGKGGSTGALGKGGGGDSGGMGVSDASFGDAGASSYSAPVTGMETNSVSLPDLEGGGGSSADGGGGGGFDWAANTSPLLGANDYNLAGSGPVGGDSGLPGAGGGVNTFGGSGVMTTGPSDANMAVPFLDTGSPGAGVSAFAAPAGVAGGSPDLADLTKNPVDVGSATQTGGTPSVVDSFKSTFGGGGGSGNSGRGGGGGGSADKSGGGSFLDSLGIKPNLGTAAAVAGLANNLITGNKNGAGIDALNANATATNKVMGEQNEAGKALQQYIATGTLPEGYESQVQAGVNAAKQRIISNYASRGMPTDPSKNSTLAQELNQVDGQVPAMREQMAKTLADAGTAMVNAGLSAAGISSSVYNNLAKLTQDQNNARGTAIANFAAALNNGTRRNSVNLKIG